MFVPGPVGASAHVEPRSTSITNSLLLVGAVKAIDTWYEFVVPSSVSTASNCHTSTSVSDESVPSSVIVPPLSLTGPTTAACVQLLFGSLCSTRQGQPDPGGPAGYAA